MAKIQNADNTKCSTKLGATGTLILSRWNTKCNSNSGRQFDSSLKLNLVLAYDPATSFLGIYQNELKICLHKNLHMDVYRRFIHNWQNLAATMMSYNTWMDKQTLIHPGVCVYVSHLVVSNSATLWTVVCQDTLPMKFSRQEYWSG